MKKESLCPDWLELDTEAEIQKISEALRQKVLKQFKKRGVVVALSGGIDSSVVGALCVQAFGKDRVFGLLMPERDSSPDTRTLSRSVAEHLGIQYAEENITSILEAVGCYRRRDEAIRQVIPEYDVSWQCKIVVPDIDDPSPYRLFSVVVESPDGKQIKARLSPQSYLGIVAATNFKQRVRKMLEYYHADRLNFAATGTPNRLEYDQGFFVKLGDGAADVKPIAHLYKTQVYQLGKAMGLPADICNRPPTTDTYSMPQSQTEFFFTVSYELLDVCLYGKNHGFSADIVADRLGISVDRIERIYKEIDTKRKSTMYLHAPAQFVDKVPEIA